MCACGACVQMHVCVFGWGYTGGRGCKPAAGPHRLPVLARDGSGEREGPGIRGLILIVVRPAFESRAVEPPLLVEPNMSEQRPGLSLKVGVPGCQLWVMPSPPEKAQGPGVLRASFLRRVVRALPVLHTACWVRERGEDSGSFLRS